MTDTSTAFCERLAQDCELGRRALGEEFPSGQAILDDCAKTLRLIATERDALRAALEAVVDTTDGKPGSLVQECRQIARVALAAYEATKEQSDG